MALQGCHGAGFFLYKHLSPPPPPPPPPPPLSFIGRREERRGEDLSTSTTACWVGCAWVLNHFPAHFPFPLPAPAILLVYVLCVTRYGTGGCGQCISLFMPSSSSHLSLPFPCHTFFITTTCLLHVVDACHTRMPIWHSTTGPVPLPRCPVLPAARFCRILDMDGSWQLKLMLAVGRFFLSEPDHQNRTYWRPLLNVTYRLNHLPAHTDSPDLLNSVHTF